MIETEKPRLIISDEESNVGLASSDAKESPIILQVGDIVKVEGLYYTVRKITNKDIVMRPCAKGVTRANMLHGRLMGKASGA